MVLQKSGEVVFPEDREVIFPEDVEVVFPEDEEVVFPEEGEVLIFLSDRLSEEAPQIRRLSEATG